MANKYTKTPYPPKEILEELYHDKFMTQEEIGKIYGTTQKVVCRWFKDLKIKSRKPYKRNQYGHNNSSWKGSSATYAAFHYRVYAKRGKAFYCEICGKAEGRMEWANINGRYDDVFDYKMMCCSCHKKHDGIANNFPNNRKRPLINKRKLIDGK